VSNPAAVGESGPTEEQLAKIRPLGNADHWRGPAEAEVVLVEYSDLECPFCKEFHESLKTYTAQNPNVAWVYRHFPLEALHPKARAEAEAAECAAELGGPPGSEASNEIFWQYIDRIFEVTPANNGLDLALLPEFAVELGLERTAFEECLASERHEPRLQADLDNAVEGGARGTPFTVMMAANGRRVALGGYLPAEGVAAAVEELLAE
jgi:protein-disulfide isomerase